MFELREKIKVKKWKGSKIHPSVSVPVSLILTVLSPLIKAHIFKTVTHVGKIFTFLEACVNTPIIFMGTVHRQGSVLVMIQTHGDVKCPASIIACITASHYAWGKSPSEHHGISYIEGEHG